MSATNLTTPLETPVLFIVFNRADVTRKSFEALRAAKPTRLFVAADGPRENKPGEAEKCAAVRAIFDEIDWPCEVKTRFRSINLGCGRGPADAITWFFSEVEEGIILEDDIVASPEFFRFTTELLEKYRHDPRVMQIGGTNLLADENRSENYSYYFSRHDNIWGWATWRRAWALYDYRMMSYPKARLANLRDSFFTQQEFEHHVALWDKSLLLNDSIDWWDYQWEYCLRVNGGLTIWPTRNLVANIGIGPEATHTKNPNGKVSRLKWQKMEFPLRHPDIMVADRSRDVQYHIVADTNFKSRIKFRVKHLIPAMLQLVLVGTV